MTSLKFISQPFTKLFVMRRWFKRLLVLCRRINKRYRFVAWWWRYDERGVPHHIGYKFFNRWYLKFGNGA